VIPERFCCSKWATVISRFLLEITVIVACHSLGGKDDNALFFYVSSTSIVCICSSMENIYGGLRR
jgi:hypothetical protein